jgi:CRISPR-associated endonuclease/helicase Cas3
MKKFQPNKYIAHKRKFDGKEQYVHEHLIGTANLSKQYAIIIGLPNIGELIGIIHDLGKYSADFQEYLESIIRSWTDPTVLIKWKKGDVDHSTAGAQYIWKNYDRNNKIYIFLAQIISLCVASHHAGLIDCITPEGDDNFSRRMNKADEKTHLNEVVEKCEGHILKRINELLNSQEILQEFTAAMKRLMDGKSKIVQFFNIGLITRFLFSCLIDADRTDTSDFENPEKKLLRSNNQYPEWDEFIVLLEKKLDSFKIKGKVDEIRRDVSLVCKKRGVKNKGLYTLSVPTGGGKTLASLRFALEHAKKHGLTRILFIIPYTSIIDQNADEVRTIFSNLSEKYGNEMILEHHSNLTPDKDTVQSKVLSENWDAPIVFTTMVQLLEALFNSGTRGVRRMHQLAGSVVIFDEIQTLPVRMVHIFNNAINFLVNNCGSSVLLCTATQPCLHRVDPGKGSIELSKDPKDSEIIQDVKKLFQDLRRTSVMDKRKAGGWSTSEVAALVNEELLITGSVLVVVNTKKSACNLFKACRNFNAKLVHLSTDMCPDHRRDILKIIKKDTDIEHPSPIICISTQLIEAGVNVDFGSVIRYLAGFDSIAQAAGRCNRHGLREIGRVIIVNPSEEKLGPLVDIEIGKIIGERVLSEFHMNEETFNNDLLHPGVMELFFKYYFFARKDEMEYPIKNTKIDRIENLVRLLSLNDLSVQNYIQKQKVPKRPDYPWHHSFHSAAEAFKAIDPDTQGIIVPYRKGKDIIARLCASQNILKEHELMKQAQHYSVNCYQDRILRLGIGENGALHDILGSGILCLKPEHYSIHYGISDEPDYSSMEFSEA